MSGATADCILTCLMMDKDTINLSSKDYLFCMAGTVDFDEQITTPNLR